MSTVYLAKETLPLMQERRWGRFIAITSVTVKQPIEGLILSNSVRAGVSGLVKTLANEYGPYNVLVNNVCPGYTATARLVDLAARLAEAEGVTVAGHRGSLGGAGAAAAARPAGGVREPGGVPGVGAGQLHHGSVDPGGRRARERVVLSGRRARTQPHRGSGTIGG